MKTKTFTIVKTAYTAGVYGCSGEYFTCIYTYIEKVKGNDYNGGKDFERVNFDSFKFQGMYGPEQRISDQMQAKGYFYTYTEATFGKCTRSDIRNVKGEHEAIEYIKNNFK